MVLSTNQGQSIRQADLGTIALSVPRVIFDISIMRSFGFDLSEYRM